MSCGEKAKDDGGAEEAGAPLKLGFKGTGTRRGMTRAQVAAVARYVEQAAEVHHGAGRGDDEKVHLLGRLHCLHAAPDAKAPLMVLHPRHDARHLMPTIPLPLPGRGETRELDGLRIHEPRSSLRRDHYMVHQIDVLLVAVAQERGSALYSDTWRMVQMAREHARAVLVVRPSGMVEIDAMVADPLLVHLSTQQVTMSSAFDLFHARRPTPFGSMAVDHPAMGEC